MKYDLEERTITFAQSIIQLCKSVKETTITKPIISQLVRSATSIGANYREANGASSKKDFCNKITICKKEAKETMYWLQILANTEESVKGKCRTSWQEAKELALIFSKIVLSSK